MDNATYDDDLKYWSACCRITRRGTDGRADRGGGRTRGCFGDQGDGRNDGLGGQVGGQGSEVNGGDQGRGQGASRNKNGDAINDHIQSDVRNATEGNDCRGCTYKEFLACNPKEYDGKGGFIVYTRWMEKMESNHTMVGAGHAAYTDRFHELARLVPHLVTPKGKRIERSFDVIIRMDWLSDHKAEIICHEKVVRIPVLDNKVLRVLGEKPKEKIRQLKNVNAKEKEQEEIVIVRDFLVVSLDDLSGLPSVLEIEFLIELIPSATSVAKSPYRLAPSELEELSRQLKELQDKELFSDHDCKIRYHPGKENVVADALSRKEKVKPKRIRAINITLQSSIKDMILAAQKEASHESTRLQRGIDEMVELRSDGALYYPDRIWVSLEGDVKVEHQRPSGLLQQLEIPKWKYEGIAIDFVTKYPMTSSGHDTIWVIVDRLTKSAYFLPMREDYKMDRFARLYEIARHGVPISIIFDRDSQFTSRFWQSLQEALGTRLDMNFGGSWDVHIPLVEFSYNNSYYSSVRCAPFEALYGRKCRSLVMWAEVGEGHLIGPELEERKTSTRFIGPFEITKKVGPTAYRLDLPEELNSVHDTFHVSNLKKCLADPTLHVPLDEIRVNDKLKFIEEPMEIMEQEFKKLKRSIIAIIKVRWNSKRRPEFTWECEDHMKLKYPYLFSASSS
nr:hypothetical protein [Tanacetum cinerariifolium]